MVWLEQLLSFSRIHYLPILGIKRSIGSQPKPRIQDKKIRSNNWMSLAYEEHISNSVTHPSVNLHISIKNPPFPQLKRPFISYGKLYIRPATLMPLNFAQLTSDFRLGSLFNLALFQRHAEFCLSWFFTKHAFTQATGLVKLNPMLPLQAVQNMRTQDLSSRNHQAWW